jgi:hypothetical protein
MNCRCIDPIVFGHQDCCPVAGPVRQQRHMPDEPRIPAAADPYRAMLEAELNGAVIRSVTMSSPQTALVQEPKQRRWRYARPRNPWTEYLAWRR